MLMPLNWRLSPAELDYQLDDAEPALLLVDPEHDELAGAARRAPRSARPLGDVGDGGAPIPRQVADERRPPARLHVGDDRPSEGRRAHARELLLDEPRLRPLDRRVAATTSCSRCCRSSTAAAGTCTRCSRGGRARASCSSASSTPTACLELIQSRGDHAADGRAGDLPVPLAGGRLRRRRPVEPAARRRRRGSDARDAARDVAAPRRRHRPGLRADRGGAERALPAARGRRAGRWATPASRTRT